MKIGAIILAAGASTRMGTSKQMLEIQGENLLTRTIKTVAAAGIDDMAIVLGAREQTHRAVLGAYKADIVINTDWERGMGSSIKRGLKYLMASQADLDAAIIFVCDQPMLTSDIISEIVSAFLTTKKPIVASGYSDSAGVPALFARSLFTTLNDLPDDQGAKKIIKQHPADVVMVPFPGGEIDLDTIEDYQKFVSAAKTDAQSGGGGRRI